MLQTLYDGLLTTMLSTVNVVSGHMSGALATPIAAAATIYIIGYGIAILRGSADGSGMDFCIQALKLAIIYTLVTNAGNYTSWVGDVVVVGIPDFVSTLSGGSPGGLPSDGVMAQAGIISERITEEYGAFDLAGRIYAAILSAILNGIAILFGAIAFIVTLIAHFGLAFMAAIGPLFIAFSLYDFSRGWFFSWLSQVLNFAILQLLVTLLAIFATTFIGNVFAESSAVAAAIAYSYMLFGLLVVIIFFFLIPSIAASLVGGAQASTGVMQRAAERSLLRGRNRRGGSTQAGRANRAS